MMMDGPKVLSLASRHAPDAVRRIGSELRSAYRRYALRKKLAPCIDRIRDLSMVPEVRLNALGEQVLQVLSERIPGDFVECGVWRGGASFLMAGLLERERSLDRRVWLFDSFEGLPPPDEIDGPGAAAWAEDIANPWYHDNCRASLEEVRAAAVRLGLDRRCCFVPGFFQDTLERHRDSIGPISLLRIDADWYASVRCCLRQLYDQISEGGFIVIDDYYIWDGCAIAVHEFLADRRLAHRIDRNGCAYFRKL